MLTHQFISIEGNIGSGKTSLVKMISKQFAMRPVFEQFEENPFLPSFYRDPARYAFQVELAFLADRFHQLKNELSNMQIFDPKVVSDYIFSKSLVFAGVTLNDQEYRLFDNLFKIIHQQLPKPDLVVYLYVEPEQLIKNIQKRGRAYESEIKTDYLRSVHEGYFRHFAQLGNQPVLIIDTTELDFVSNGKDYKALIDLIDKRYPPGITRIERDSVH